MPQSLTDISDNKRTDPKWYSTSTFFDKPDSHHHDNRRQERKIRCHRSTEHYCSPTRLESKQDLSEPGLKFLIPVSYKYQKDVEYHSYHHIHKSQRYRDNVGFKIRKMLKRSTVQMKDQVLNGKDPISVINFMNAFKWVYHFSSIQEGAAICLFREFMNGSSIVAIKPR